MGLLDAFKPPSPGEIAEAKAKTQALIDENTVMVFSKSYCPYSGATKLLLKSLGAKYCVVEVKTVSGGKLIHKALLELNGQSSVPNIYINGKHIGGNSELQSIGRSRLKEILRDMGALE